MIRKKDGSLAAVIYADGIDAAGDTLPLANTGDGTLQDGDTLALWQYPRARFYIFISPTETFSVETFSVAQSDVWGPYSFQDDIAENPDYDGGDFTPEYGCSVYTLQSFSINNVIQSRCLYLSGVLLADDIVSDFDDAGDDSLQAFVVETRLSDIEFTISGTSVSFHIEHMPADGVLDTYMLYYAGSFNNPGSHCHDDGGIPDYPLPYDKDDRYANWRTELYPDSSNVDSGWAVDENTVLLRIRRALTGDDGIDNAIALIIQGFLNGSYSNRQEVIEAIEDMFENAGYDYQGDLDYMLDSLFPPLDGIISFDGSLEAAKDYCDNGGFVEITQVAPSAPLNQHAVYLSAYSSTTPSTVLNPFDLVLVVQPTALQTQLGITDDLCDLDLTCDGYAPFGKCYPETD